MEQYEQIAAILALSMGASWASGINLYAAMAVLGYSGASGSMELPADLKILEHPMVMGAAMLMYVVEFFADKMPGVDTGWDTIHTFIRIPAGAMLAAGAVGDAAPAMELTAAILGGGMAAATHATKAGSRVIINTSPEPFSNWAASITEDVAVIGGLWTALHHPWIFLGLMALFILLMAWLLPKIWQTITRFFRWLGGRSTRADTAGPTGEPLAQLARLKELLDSGALTETEYNQQKKRLLSAAPPERER